ncbi:MAG TPA: response regulator [Devosiaceae bacterium]|jgi:CheY-like chemotaxis protein|nr:response regulator [Devosiaceae bacterium]
MQNAIVVLVVEDEPLVRMETVDMVEAAGYLVVEAANADEAIAILESRSDIRLVLTDIDMPGSIDGSKLAHAVRKRWPPIPIVVVSGKSVVDDSDLPENTMFYSKPYDRAVVTGTLGRLLGG